MADERIVTSIVANSDFSNLIADVQRVTSSLFKLQQEFAGANRALAGQINATNAMFKETMLKTGQFSSHFVSLTSDVEKFGRNLDSGRLKLRDYFRVYQEHTRTSSGLIRDLAKQQVQLQNAVLQPLGRNAQGLMQYNVHIPRGLDLTKNKASILKQELQIMNKVIQDGGVQLINWGKNTQWAGRQLTVGLTLPLAAFGKAAADAFKVADQELTRLTKVYGDVAGTSAQELSKVRNEVSTTAKELSAAMGVNFAETISLAADIAATGKTGNELLSSVSETTRLAVLGEVDRQEAMKATLAIQSAFKANTEELAESINFLNAVENQTSTTLNDLVEAIPKAGPVIKGLGGDIQDLALYLTAMREGGINASEGANALKSALASLINPTDVAVAKFKGFGIDLLGIVKNNAGDVTATLFALQAALDRLDPLSKQQAIEQLFGKFQFSRLNALFENLGRQGSQTLQVLDLMQASAGELEAVAGRELAAVTESAAGRFRRAVESLKAELAGVGEDFLNIGTKLINVLSGIIDFAQKLPDPIKKVLAFGGAFTAIIGPVIMLTGVLANFFGYIIKGLGHFKALFKGAEGFKLLTPEIMAARAASEQLGNEFYSDARAADTLRLAIEKLNQDLLGLQVNARRAAEESSKLGTVITTTAGAPIMPMGAGRTVDPTHPLLGGQSRAAAHLNPRDPSNPSTIFGLTMQPIPVNRRLGSNPQILMQERLPDVPGLTTISGVSTGVVAGEHARYAALMAAIGLQSRQEIEALKKTIALGGQVSKEFIDTFDDILPITQRLTANAAAQSAQIVAELKAGKLNVQQARAAIIAVNADLERTLGVQITQYGAGRGRTIDLTKAPLIDQPVVDVAGKPNLRGMFRQGGLRDVMEALGRATRTRTMGGPYSIETTRPQGLNMGGNVFYNDGNQVPGPNINADVVPAMLTPGEFVIRRDVAQTDPEGMRALNEGRAVVVPIQNRNLGGAILAQLALRSRQIGASRARYLRSGRGPSTRDIAEQNTGSVRYGQIYRAGSSAWKDLESYGLNRPSDISALLHGSARPFRERISGLPRGQSETAIANRAQMEQLGVDVSRSKYEDFIVLPNNFVLYAAKNSKSWNSQLRMGRARGSDFEGLRPGDMTSLGIVLKDAKVPKDQALVIMKNAADEFNSIIRNKDYVNSNFFGDTLDQVQKQAVAKYFNLGFNRGGKVPGYQAGGIISRASLLARLGAKFSYQGRATSGPQALQTYAISSMAANGGKKYFGDIPGLSNKARGALYAATLDFFNSSLIRQSKVNGQRGFVPRQFLTAMPSIASRALLIGKDFMTPQELAIIESMRGKGSSLTGTVGSSRALARVYGDVFRANRGGRVPRYQVGGTVGGTPLRSTFDIAQERFGEQPTTPVAAVQSPQFGMGSMIKGSIASLAGYQAGAMLGGRFGQTGSMIGGMLGGMVAPSLLMGWGRSAGEAAAKGNLLSRALTAVVGGLTKTNLIIGGSVAALGLGIKLFNEYNETQRLSAAAFGLTAESAEKAGLKYTDFNQKIKDAVAAQKMMVDQNKMTYESLQSAGTPFKMTIAEYKELRKQLKETMKEQIDVINAVQNKDVSRLAVQLKEQLMAAGLSAEEAAKRIYTLFALSEKSGMAGQAISTDQFRQIVDAQTAAASAIQSFGYAKGFENTRDQAAALNTALTALNTGVEDLFKKSEKAAEKQGKQFNESAARYEAEKKQLDIIAGKVEKQDAIGVNVLNNLKKQNPELAKMVNETDTVVSIFQKLRLVAQGFSGDLSKLNAQQVEAVYRLQAATSQAVQQSNKARGGLLDKEYKAYGSLRKEIAALEKAAKGQSVKEQIDTRERLRAIDKEISKIKERAEAKKKALREERQDEDVRLQIQKKQLEYQDMLAAGDLSGAAQTQLDIERLVGEQQLTLTERAIDADTERRTAPLLAERSKIEKANESLADKAAIAAESLESMNKRLSKQKDNIDNVNLAMTNLQVALEMNKDNIEKFKTTDEFKGLAAALVSAVQGTGKVVALPRSPEVRNGQIVNDVGLQAMGLMEKYGKDLTTIVASKGVTVTATGDIVIGGKSSRTISAPDFKNPSTMFNPAGGFGTTFVFDKKIGKWGYVPNNQITKDMVTYQDWQKGKTGYAGGGLLRGPGTGTSDSIIGMYANGGMVRVSNGEYIVNADTVSRLGVPFFDRINGMKNGGLMLNYNVPKYGDGNELIQAMAYNPGMSAASNSALYNINVTLNGANMNPEDVARVISREMKMRESMNGRTRTIGG